MIAVVDYRKGNLQSVARGLADAGGDVRVTDDAAVIARADAIVLPGVGAFADAAASMAELGQTEVVRDRIDAGVPFLGICLGMHLMFEEGMEGAPDEDDEESSRNAKGLAVLPGVVCRMPKIGADGRSYKIPHVGWNSIVAPNRRPEAPLSGAQAHPGPLAAPVPGGFSCPIFADTKPGEYFYFTHSYVAPDTPATVAVTEHSIAFPSAVQFRDSAFGVQFHPEKSSDAGAAVLRAFVRFASER